MREQHLQTLIRQIEAGSLSKNKHFEAYRDPMVREAKQRQVRLRAIREVLAQAEDDWYVQLTREADDRWRLTCRSPRWNLAWSAALQTFELDLLRESPAIAARLDGSLTREVSLSSV